MSTTTSTRPHVPIPGARLSARMTARSPHEPHRASTPLELFFDLVFVVAIAQAASGLHHAIAEAHALQGLVGFLMVFFAIWWAWMNFTWFASAYDCDDVPYRVAVFVQITGALILAAGVPAMFESARPQSSRPSSATSSCGSPWSCSGCARRPRDPDRAVTARRYALGITHRATRVDRHVLDTAVLGCPASSRWRRSSWRCRSGPSGRRRRRGIRITSLNATGC